MTIDRKSRLIARVLAGSWRFSRPPLDLSSDELRIVTPALLETGAGALGWRRVEASSLRTTPAAFELQQAYRLHSLQAVGHERNLAQILTLFNAEAVEAILVKGWAIARQYPEPGLRPYGDV